MRGKRPVVWYISVLRCASVSFKIKIRKTSQQDGFVDFPSSTSGPHGEPGGVRRSARSAPCSGTSRSSSRPRLRASRPTRDFANRRRGGTEEAEEQEEAAQEHARVERLFKDASARKAKMEQRRQSYEAQNTFTPKITKLGRLSVSPRGECERQPERPEQGRHNGRRRRRKIGRDEDSAEQLYADAKARAARHAKRIKDVQATEAPFGRLCRRSPRDACLLDRRRGSPCSARMFGETDKARAELKAKLLEETEKIEKTRVKRTPYQSKRKQGTNSVVARMEAAARSKARKERLKLEQLAKENEMCSFQPNTEILQEQRQDRMGSTHSTGCTAAQKSRRRRENARKKRLEDETPSFRPDPRKGRHAAACKARLTTRPGLSAR